MVPVCFFLTAIHSSYLSSVMHTWVDAQIPEGMSQDTTSFYWPIIDFLEVKEAEINLKILLKG